jgi:PAS domain S-box-containing protein
MATARGDTPNPVKTSTERQELAPPPSFEQALHTARALLVSASQEPDHRRKSGPLLAEIDRLLAEQNRSLALTAGLTPITQSVPPNSGDVESLRREVERLSVLAERNEGMLSAVLFESPHGILVCDQTGKLILHNKAAERIWAGSATTETMEDWGQYRAFHPDGRPYGPGDWSMTRCLIENTTVEAEEVHFQRFDGTHGMLLGSCAPIRDPAGKLMGAVSVFADITGFKQVEQLKDRWVALAGHEIRSPLQVLKSRISMAQHALGERQAVDLPKLLDILMRQVDRLQTLVNDMLDASRAQAGTLHVAPEPTPLVPLVVRTAESVVHSSPKHQLELETEDVVVLADKARTEQLVTNLVSNAVRYSPTGGRIKVRVRPHENGALVEVQDEGIGFAPEHAQSLFEPFLQLTQETRRDGGLGLGLYLSRELVERMKGRIWASSAGPAKGATFAFTLPSAAEG